jgi:DNA-directed RNA polymerase I subunit RPA1
VKCITNPITFDTHQNAQPDGLYDRALGPSEPMDLCTTCHLGYAQCPGHFGHLELPVPVYHPLVFGTLTKILRATCLHCFHLRVRATDVDRFRRRARLLMRGQLVEALATVGGSTATTAAARKALGEDLTEADGVVDREDLSEDEDDDLQKSRSTSSNTTASTSGRLSAHAVSNLRNLFQELLSSCPAQGKCANCGAHNPTVKKDGSSKLFLMPLAAKREASNKVQGTMVHSVLEALRATAAEAQREVEEAAIAGWQHNDHHEDDDDDDDEEATEHDDEVMAGDDDDDDKKGHQQPSKRTKVKKNPTSPATDLAGAAPDSAWSDPTLEKRRPKYITPSEAEEIARLLWSNEARTLRLFFASGALLPSGRRARPGANPPTPLQGPEGYRLFFLRSLPVAPNKFRPVSRLGEDVYEHAQNVMLAKAMTASRDLLKMSAEGVGRAVRVWLILQDAVAGLMDSNTVDATRIAGGAGQIPPGIKQILEKKEGLFRMNMMGKRLNFAARSVISPDVYLSPGEIGVPPYFARKLSFPERVTAYNVERLRELVLRGALVYPGAVAVEDEKGRLISLERLSATKREAIAKQLLGMSTTPAAHEVDRGRGKIVYRHLIDGDLMLTNRQPTLHKPGLMAHRARVLKGERTIRMHYANCATFNADFDGDEINLHLPQDHLARAEGYHIVHADQQFIVPTDGKPIRGLIQDHIFGATLLTKKDTFLTREQFAQLLYAACSPTTAGSATEARAWDRSGMRALVLPAPAIYKPRPLWTGKQLVTSSLAWLTRGQAPLTTHAGHRVPNSYWGSASHDATCEFFRGELVTGALDKNAFGKFGVVHAVQEVYGGEAASRLLAIFSRLFTHYVQQYGFTCGLDDCLVRAPSEAVRAELLATAEPRARRRTLRRRFASKKKIRT